MCVKNPSVVMSLAARERSEGRKTMPSAQGLVPVFLLEERNNPVTRSRPNYTSSSPSQKPDAAVDLQQRGVFRGGQWGVAFRVSNWLAGAAVL